MQTVKTAQDFREKYPSIYNTLVEHLKVAEGLRLSDYQDVAGVRTIGYGHTRDVTRGMHITVADAERLLDEDISACFPPLFELSLRLSPYQVIALVDFIFQFGWYKFRMSTLLDRIRGGQGSQSVVKEFRRWIYYRSCGKMVPSTGLAKRAEWRVKMWLHK